MKVCIPVEEYRGLDSRVFDHFGSAPAFALVDTETLAVEPVDNRDEHHEHGQCSPVKAMGGRQVNAVIVGGIGPGAIRGLQQAGIQVCRFTGGTVAEAVQAFKARALPALNLNQACGGHNNGHSCHDHEN
jgi:predicted Fe-Mo cluster-binding NifX family protein